jgi:hypothetical protein
LMEAFEGPLACTRRTRGEDEGQCMDVGGLRKSTGQDDGAASEDDNCTEIGGQSVECQIDCESCQLY